MKLAAMLHPLMQGEDLSGPQAQQAMREILTGEPGDAVVAAFLTALRIKGESVEEVAAFAREIRAHALRIASKHRVDSWPPTEVRQFKTLTHPDFLGRAFRVLIQSSLPLDRVGH